MAPGLSVTGSTLDGRTLSRPAVGTHQQDWVAFVQEEIWGLARSDWASLVAQWYGIRLPVQETQVQSWGREDPLE